MKSLEYLNFILAGVVDDDVNDDEEDQINDDKDEVVCAKA